MRPRTQTLVVVAIIAITGKPTSPVLGVDAQAPAATGAFCVLAAQRQLFLDDYGIGSIENLRRSMHRPEKRGAVIRSPDPRQTVQTRTAPVWDPAAKLFKLWVLGIDQTFWQSQ